MKYVKYTTIALIVIIAIALRSACKSENKPLAKSEIEKNKNDSIKAAKEKQIDYALTELKELTKKQLKDPRSFEMLTRTWDRSDSLKDKVKLLISFRANNSFGGKSKSTVLGTFYVKTGIVKVDKIVNE